MATRCLPSSATPGTHARVISSRSSCATSARPQSAISATYPASAAKRKSLSSKEKHHEANHGPLQGQSRSRGGERTVHSEGLRATACESSTGLALRELQAPRRRELRPHRVAGGGWRS